MSAALTEAFELKPWHTNALRELAANPPDAWTSTSDIGRAIWGIFPPRSSSSTARGVLESLEGQRFVEAYRQSKPVIWRITDAGRAALAKATGGAA